MLTRLRRLASAFAAVALASACVSVAAYAHDGPGAATCPPVDVASSTKSAMAVFEGIVDAEPTTGPKADGSRGAVYTHQVTVTTVYQGRIRTTGVQVQTDRTPHQCSLGPLKVGRDYLFFVQGSGEPWVAVSGGGTARATPGLVAQVQTLLGDGRPPVPPTPESATFTPLHPAAPRTLARTAAPGAALVLVGVLGLVLVRSLGRRSRSR